MLEDNSIKEEKLRTVLNIPFTRPDKENTLHLNNLQP